MGTGNNEGSPTCSVTPRVSLSPPGAAQAGITGKGFSGVLALLVVWVGGVSGAASVVAGFCGGVRQA